MNQKQFLLILKTLKAVEKNDVIKQTFYNKLLVTVVRIKTNGHIPTALKYKSQCNTDKKNMQKKD